MRTGFISSDDRRRRFTESRRHVGVRERDYHLAPLRRRPGFPQREDVAADGHLPPQAGPGALAEAVARVHHQHAVGGQSVHLTVLRPPLGGFLLRETSRPIKYHPSIHPPIHPPSIH